MSKKNKNRIALVVGLSLLTIIFFSLRSNSPPIHNKSIEFSSLSSKNIISDKQSEIKSEPLTAAVKSPSTERSNSILLNSENFESLSGECFQGAVCEMEGHPWTQYLAIKHEGKKNVTDLYIAFLRKKLSDPKFKEHYKETLKSMIQDFYSAEQLDFQMAVYYNYLGDLDSSLQTYLALEKKAKANPKIFSAPKLNIANTYYDLKRFKEALIYYKASLNDLKSTETNDSLESIAFINERIDLIQEKLRR